MNKENNLMIDIRLKNQNVFMGLALHIFHIRLIEIICWINRTFDFILLTETFRHQTHSNDLHGTKPVRAIDIRAWAYQNPIIVVRAINKKFIYDSERPWKKVAVYHQNNQKDPKANPKTGIGYHLHIQVHPNTRERMNGE